MDIQSLKSASSFLLSEVKVQVLPPLEGNNKWRKMNKHTK